MHRNLFVLIAACVLILFAACSPNPRFGMPVPTHIPAGIAEPIAEAPATDPITDNVDSGIQSPGPGTPAGRIVEVRLEDPDFSGAHRFDPEDLEFNVGETVNFVLTSEGQLHTFTVNELEINRLVPATQTLEFTYTFAEPGAFALVCVPHEAFGMVGTITVS